MLCFAAGVHEVSQEVTDEAASRKRRLEEEEEETDRLLDDLERFLEDGPTGSKYIIPVFLLTHSS